jgi:endonuclease/exonuclease/phosphatase family metal-dependent hydrolase
MRLMSYNIHKGIGGRDRLYRPERVMEVIRREAPDILCLQEVDRNVRRSNRDNQPDMLARELGYDFSAFQFNHRVNAGGYGNLVLSRFPVIKRHNLSLRYRGRKNRRAQLLVIESDRGPLRLVNWHLGLGEAERHWQVSRLLEHWRFQAYNNVPTVIVGDCNDWRNTLHRGALARHGLDLVTAPPSRFRSFPAYMPVGSLDKAFRCPRVQVAQAHVVRSALARGASDHLPLLIDFNPA